MTNPSEAAPDGLSEYVARVHEASDYLRHHLTGLADIGIILGTGLGGLADVISATDVVDYDDIPHFPVSTVESHHGRLIAGSLDGIPVLALQGRFHLYEGYDARDVTFPVRVMGELGIRTLLISNAAGGMNPLFRRADLMLVTDHINLQGANPLTGPNHTGWGSRFPDMSEPYDVELRAIAEETALSLGLKLQQGVYCAVVGPNLETRSEYRFLRTIGADAVGMSTVPEVIVARHMGMRCLAISVITDECFPDALEEVSIPEILEAAATAEPGLTEIFRGVVGRIA